MCMAFRLKTINVSIVVTDIVSSEPLEDLKDNITDLFSDPAMSGGEDVLDVFVAEDLKRAVVTYESPQSKK